MTPQAFEGQAWLIVKADEVRAAAGLPVVPAIERVRTHFQFLSWPTTIPTPNSGYVFQQGAFNNKGKIIAITGLTIYADGIHVHTQSTTEDTDDVLAEVVTLLQDMGMRVPKAIIASYHVSTIVADFSKNINCLLTAFRSISSFIGDRDYKAPLEVGLLSLYADATKLTKPFDGLNPTLFRIDRRVGVSFEENRYFSLANTTTEKHLEILNYIERCVFETKEALSVD